MTGIWLDNPKYLPQPNPFNNSAAITGDPSYITGIALFAEYSPWTITNSGQLVAAGTARAVELFVGGSVTNQTGGTITGGFEGVDIEGVGIVNNAGTITGTYAVVARPGSVITNGATNATGALVSGVNDGIFLGSYGYPASGAGTVTNFGTVRATGGSALGNGIVLNTQTASVANYGTVVGTGAKGGAAGLGIALNYGGILTNSSTGLIQGYAAGVSAGKGPATVTNAGTIAGFRQGVRLYAGGSIINLGSIKANATAVNGGTYPKYGGSGIYLKSGGSIANQLGGYVYGKFGILANNTAATITNFGTVMAAGSNASGTGAAGVGIFLLSGGTVGNYAGATIQGGGGVRIDGTSGAVYNYGTINGNLLIGVALNAGGRITNASSTSVITGASNGISLAGAVGALIINFGTISSIIGLNASASSAANTVRNFGTITGRPALAFGTGGGRLVEFPQAAINGLADGGGAATLELGRGTQSGSLAGFGSTLVGFSALQFDSGTPWTVEGGAGGFPGTITGFAISDTIDVDGFVAVSDSYTGSALVLTDTASNSVTLGIQGSFTTGQFGFVPDGSGGTDVTTTATPCFCRGTLIWTERGEVAVEDLAIGDEVVVLSGDARPIKWVGRRAYDGRFVTANRAVLPIRIEAGALDDGVPTRDLWVSPEHALYIGGVLVPAGLLVNGATIVQAESVAQVEYFHIELEAHEVIFAEGAPTETYVDCDNRLMFSNGAEYAGLHPDDDRPTWKFCAPRLEWGSQELTAIREALLERFEALGHPLDLDPDLHLIVDGEIVRPDAATPCLYRFTIPAGSAAVSLASRSTVPAEVEAAGRDLRRLGVPVERIAFLDGDLSIEAWHGHAALCEGFHQDEGSHRWTDGLARLPESWLRSFSGGATLDVQLIPTELRYRLPPPPDRAQPIAERRFPTVDSMVSRDRADTPRPPISAPRRMA
jgi:hypothetical protein